MQSWAVSPKWQRSRQDGDVAQTTLLGLVTVWLGWSRLGDDPAATLQLRGEQVG